MKFRKYIIAAIGSLVLIDAYAQINADGTLSETAIRACLEIPKRTKQMQDVIDDPSSSNERIQVARNFLKSFDTIMSKIPQDKCEEVRLKEQERLSAISQTPISERSNAAIGMTREQVENETNWGKPLRKSVSTSQYGTRELWVYSSSQSLIFENGKLVSIQQRK